MKTFQLLAYSIIFLITSQIHAQVPVNVNIGQPPAWGPVDQPAVEYYYLPDIESYYDVRTTEFIYYGNGQWVRARHLPPAHRKYDLYKGYKVVLNDYHGAAPYALYKRHKVKYYKGYRGTPQKTIGVRKVKVKQEGGDHGKGHGKGHKKH